MNQIVNQRKIWVDECSQFYNRSMKLWLERDNINFFSTNLERKSLYQSSETKQMTI